MLLRRRDRTARTLRVAHYSSAVTTLELERCKRVVQNTRHENRLCACLNRTNKT